MFQNRDGVCDKTRHVALKCYHRFDQYQAEDNRSANQVTSSYVDDPGWYTDISATGHITGDLNKLNVTESS